MKTKDEYKAQIMGCIRDAQAKGAIIVRGRWVRSNADGLPEACCALSACVWNDEMDDPYAYVTGTELPKKVRLVLYDVARESKLYEKLGKDFGISSFIAGFDFANEYEISPADMNNMFFQLGREIAKEVFR